MADPGTLFRFGVPAINTEQDAVEIAQLFEALARNNFTTNESYPIAPRSGQFRILDVNEGVGVKLQWYSGSDWVTLLDNIEGIAVSVVAPHALDSESHTAGTTPLAVVRTNASGTDIEEVTTGTTPGAGVIPVADGGGKLDSWISQATESLAGKAEVATTGEVTTASDDQRFVTPAKLKKAQANGVASLDGASKVVQDPANATATSTASKIPIADGSGLLDSWTSATGTPVSNVIPRSDGGGKLDSWVSQATESLAGKAEVATTAEVSAGVDDQRFVTPAKLAAYVGTFAFGLDPKESVRAASTQNLDAEADISGSPTYNATGGVSGRGQITATLVVSGQFRIDNVSLVSGNRLLLRDEAGGLGGAANGIWVATISGTSLTLDRAADFDSDAEVSAGSYMPVEEGTVNTGKMFILTTADPIVIGGGSGTVLTFASFGSVSSATETVQGIAELATVAEVTTAADDQRIVTPLKLGKAQANGVASLESTSLVVQNPANATATPTASKIPIADGSGKLDAWVSGAVPATTVKSDAATAAEGAAAARLRTDAQLVVATAVPGTAVRSDAAAVQQGAAQTMLRSDARLTALTATPSTNVRSDAASADQGTSESLLRSDCRLVALTGAPVSIGDTNQQGVAEELARRDHVHAVADATETQKGVAEVATSAEVVSASLDDKIVTPLKLGKAQASGVASLDASSLVVQNPTNATATPTASKIPIADGSGQLTGWIAQATESLAGKAELATVPETLAGTDDLRIVTPAKLTARVNALDAKASVRAAQAAVELETAAGITLTYNDIGGSSGRGQITGTYIEPFPTSLVIDGVFLINGDRLLVKGESSGLGADTHGIWILSGLETANFVMDRTSDFDSDADVTSGCTIVAEEGIINAGNMFVLTTVNPIVLGGGSGTALTFDEIGGDGGTPTVTVKSEATGAGGGVAGTFLRSDAQIQAATATPGTTVQSDATSAAQGSSSSLLRADAQLVAVTATAISIAAENAQGTSTSLSRADHAHKVEDASIALDKLEQFPPISLMVFDSITSVVTGGGASTALNGVFWRVPAQLNGWTLSYVAAAVFTAGTTGNLEFQVYKSGEGLLSTLGRIETGEVDTITSAQQPVIVSNGQEVLATGNILWIAVSSVQTTAPKGLEIQLGFEP